MKRLLYILLVCLPFIAMGQPYYISPSGDDGTGDGSIGDPWFSLQGWDIFL
jgi:hypothetical protein